MIKRIKRWIEWWLKRDIQMAMLRELRCIRVALEQQGKPMPMVQPPLKTASGAWTQYEPLKPLQPLGSHK